MTGNEIRKEFIKFFEGKKHKHFESATLVPNDPTLLLTVAGMVPFKPYFLGQKEAPTPRVTTYQKCIRTNDLENVGRTARHHTFFEMLGNFSFGDYFKKEAILWSYEFVTKILGLDSNKLWVSVFTTDDEAEKIWIDECHFPKERIVRFGEEDNWWAAGPTGSCGPCSEIYVDLGVKYGGDENSRLGDPGTDDRFIEIWNLVFTEWNRMEDGSLQPLPKKNIDTGAGLERITAVVQGKSNNFETDLLFPLVEYAGKLTNSTYGTNPNIDFSLKVITDHARAVTFLIGDGVIPSNEGRGYVLRRVIRRAIRHGRLLGQDKLFLNKMVDKVVELMNGAYPDLNEKKEHIKKVVLIEEEKFSRTLDQGINLATSEIEKLKSNGEDTLSGEVAFKLYDTYGFPFELTEEICLENDIKVSKDDFNNHMERQKDLARNSREIIMEKGQDDFIEKFYDEHGATEFVGYDEFKLSAKLLNARKVDENKYFMIFDKTPFYAESGGQIGDTGKILGENFNGEVVDVQKQKGIFIHTVKSSTPPTQNMIYELTIDIQKRNATRKNHTATHLLHKALKDVLGSHINQAGSYVTSEKLRFDFNHYNALTPEELSKVEELVNDKICEALDVNVEIMNIDDAKNKGAMALFGDKYGDTVRVVSAGNFSIELCGGTHIDNIGKIGLFKIESESGIASGIRRIEATTGINAYKKIKEMDIQLASLSELLKSEPTKLIEKVEKLNSTLKYNQKEIQNLKSIIADFQTKNIENNFEIINGIKVLAMVIGNKNANELREIVDKIKDRFKSCIVILGSQSDKAIFTVGVTKDLTNRVKAGNLVKIAAQVAGGNGGGRPDFAQAGGKDASKVELGVKTAHAELKKILGEQYV